MHGELYIYVVLYNLIYRTKPPLNTAHRILSNNQIKEFLLHLHISNATPILNDFLKL